MKSLPLAGKRFLVTRSQDQAADFVDLLSEQGAEAVCVPTIEIVPPESWEEFDRALRMLNETDYLVLTSANGVKAFFERLRANGFRALPKELVVAAVGPKTARVLDSYGRKADIVPTDHRAEGVVEELLERGIQDKKVLYPRAEIARPYIIDALRKAGAEVAAPVAYRTILPSDSGERIRQLLAAKQLDAICFSSSSTFENLLILLGNDLKVLQGEVRFFSIGPLTSKTIRKHGFKVDLEPEAWTLDALTRAIVAYYRGGVSAK